MTRRTIKVPEDVYEKHNERRQRLGMSWPEYIDEEAPESLVAIIRRVVREELRAILLEGDEDV